MRKILIKDARIVNRGAITEGDVRIANGRFEQVGGILEAEGAVEIPAHGKYLLPGIIDDQVHFREPGLTHKAEIYTEARAAVAGGVTSFMEMPNTKPPAVTQALLEEKYERASQCSLANFSFFMGTTNDNLDEVLRTDPRRVCGIKVFMGSSTGNMLVDDAKVLDNLFREANLLIATHCEDEATVKANESAFLASYGEDVPISCHPEIRSVDACLRSSSFAVELAKKHGTRLHVLHISTEEELALFQNDIPLADKRITSEVCVHHLFFNSTDYEHLGTLIKCNPAIKAQRHQQALLSALFDNRLDIIATDHAPHTMLEKQQTYFYAPSGLPLVQHALNVMLEFYAQGRISLERIVEKMCHAPAQCFQVQQRGFIEEGYWADAFILDLDKTWAVAPENIHYKCGWSPFEGHTFRGLVETTFVNGHLAYDKGQFIEENKGMRLAFDR
jgi:dihydroorotase